MSRVVKQKRKKWWVKKYMSRKWRNWYHWGWRRDKGSWFQRQRTINPHEVYRTPWEAEATSLAWSRSYFAPSGGAKYCDQRVCMSVCLSVCRLMYLKHMPKLHELFCNVNCGLGTVAVSGAKLLSTIAGLLSRSTRGRKLVLGLGVWGQPKMDIR